MSTEASVADETLATEQPPSEMDTTPTGETPASETATPEKQASPDATELAKELESLKAALKKANKESAGHRQKAKELDDLKAQIEAEKLSETEKLQKQLAKLQAERDEVTRQSQERTINYEVRLQAARLGIADPTDAVKLLDWSEIEYDDAGTPTNVEDLLRQLVKAKPYLVANTRSAPTTSGGATNPSRSQTTAPEPLSWTVISKMTTQQYEARRPEIQQWLANPQNTRRM